MKTLQSSNPMEVILLWISFKKDKRARQKRSSEDTNLLAVTGCAIFSLSTMDEGGCFVIETVQTIGRLIHVCIILRHKLPSHFRWDDIIMRRVTVGRSGIRHNGVEYATEVRPGRRFWAGAHTEKCNERRQRNKREENLRGIERASSGRWINLVEDVRKTQRGQRTKDEHSASSVSL